MKNIFTFLALIVVISASAQKRNVRYGFANLVVDPNQLVGIVDNPRTKNEVKGLDFDLEIGARDRRISVYVFYGSFSAIKYQNYGVGVDYNIQALEHKKINLTLGVTYGSILRKYEGDTGFANFLAYSGRGTATWWIMEDLGAIAVAKIQQRPDNQNHIFEFSIGLSYKIDR